MLRFMGSQRVRHNMTEQLNRTETFQYTVLYMVALGNEDTLSWTARRSNPSILKEISPGISLEGMMLKLKLQYFAPHAKS